MTYRDAFETCPRCGVDLVDARSARGCPQCRGLWIEEGIVAEMVLAMLPPQPLTPLELAVIARQEEPIACPACKEQMHATTIHGVMLDRCPKHGVWFDAGELQTALLRVADPSGRPAAPAPVAHAPPLDARAAPELTIAWQTPGHAPETVRLRQEVVKIGRAPSAHVRLDDPRAERMHALIDAARASDVYLIDLGSHHGTWVNGRRIQKYRLAGSDHVLIGATTLDLTLEM